MRRGRGGGWATCLGIPRNQWVAMHDYVSLVFAALLILHLLLHWKFLRNIDTCLNTDEKTACEPES
jgi:hypothetical protein